MLRMGTYPVMTDSSKESKSETIRDGKALEELKSVNRNTSGMEVENARAANLDQFPSDANLRVPNAKDIEPFQIVDGSSSIASSRKVEPAINESFHEGLKALGSDASPEQLAQMQIDYMNRKASQIGIDLDGEYEAGSFETPSVTMLKGEALYFAQKNSPDGWLDAGRRIAQLPLDKQIQVLSVGLIAGLEQNEIEQRERDLGSIIGTVQGIGNVAVDLAKIADFAAYCLIGDDERAGEMAEVFGKSIGETIVSGVRLFQAAQQYSYDVGYSGDYSKPLKDLVVVGQILDDRWNSLSPLEQEKLKYEIGSQMATEGLIGAAGLQAVGNAKSVTEVLDLVARQANTMGTKIGGVPKKLVGTISNGIREILLPVGDTGMGVKMPIPKNETAMFMSDAEDLGRARIPKEIKSVESNLKNPLPRSLSSVQARDWYNAKVSEIDEVEKHMRSLGHSAKEIFEKVTKLRNEVKLQARALMKDQASAKTLPPPKSLEEILANMAVIMRKLFRLQDEQIQILTSKWKT